jgi:hypothetical protein
VFDTAGVIRLGERWADWVVETGKD